MKQLRLLMAAFAAVFGLCVNAQTWTPSEVGEGTFYLYNVGAEGYIVGANNWGTRASIAKIGGISVTLAPLGDGNYSISCAPTYQNNYLGANGYIDRPVGESSWSFVPVEGQTNVYKMVCSAGTFFADEGATTTTVGEDPNNVFAYWKLVSHENRLADLATATPDNPKDATFLILNPNFSRNGNNSAWVMESTGSTNLAGGPNENYCAECYMGTFTLAQELTVPNGIYQLTGQGAVTYHDDRVKKTYDGGAKPEFYIGDATVGFEEMVEADQLSNMTQLANAFLAGNYQLPLSDAVTVANGKVTIGTRSERADIWAIWDNFQLFYLGELQDLGPIVEAYEKALADAKELLNTTETVGKNPLASLRAATILNGESRVDKTSKESLETATKNLNDAMDAVKKSIASYKVIAAGELPSNSIAGWTCTNEQAFHVNTWSKEADNTGMTTPFIENWINAGEGTLGDGMIYYTLEGLNPGEIYYAQALVRAFSEAGNAIAGVSFFVNNDETDIAAKGTPYTYNNTPGVYGTFGNIATVGTDGKLTIGVKLNGASFNWVAIKNVSIQNMDAALQASIDKVEAFYGKLPTAVEEPTKNFVENTKAIVKDNDTFQTAIQALNDKADELAAISNAFVAAQAFSANSKYFEEVKALCEVSNYKELTAGAHDKLAGAVSAFALPVADMNTLNNFTTAEDINQYAADLAAQAANADKAIREAGIEYYNNAVPTGDSTFPVSFVLTNANLEGLPTWNKCEGWGSERTIGNSQVMVNADATSEDGTKTAFYEYWSEQPAADGTFTLFNTANLLPGKYTVSGYAFATQATGGEDCNVKFFVNDIEGAAITSQRLAPTSVIEFEVAEGDEVKIGLKALEGNFFRWMGIGYLTLNRLAEAEEPAPEFKLAFNPESGTEVAVDDEIAFEFDSDNFQLWITTDGSDPTTSETAMNLFPNETVKVAGEGEFVVKAVLEDNKTNLKSEVFTATYPIKAVAPFELTFNPESGTEVAVDDEIAFEFDSDNFQLWVTTDGTDPTTSLTAMNLFPNETVKVAGEGEFVVKAVLENNKTNQKSEVFTATYPIKAAVKDIVLTDDDTEAPAPGEYETITYDRKFLKGYNTIVLPFDYTNLELGADVVMKYDGTKDNHVQLIRLKDDEVMKANVPYVVFVRTDKKIAGFDKNKTVVEPDDLTVPGGEFDFVGSYKAYAKGESPVKRGDYIFRSDLQKAKGGNEHKAYRGYLKSTTGVETANLYIVVDGELDGISTIENAQKADGYIYNLNGQRVNDTKKGIFIINGKKVVKK